MKLYIDLKGADKLKDQISCDFETTSMDLLIQDSDCAHRRLFVSPLARSIWPEKSKITVKPNKIVVSLHKQDRLERWTQLGK